LAPTALKNSQKRPEITAHPLLFPSTLPVHNQIFPKQEGVTHDVPFDSVETARITFSDSSWVIYHCAGDMRSDGIYYDAGQFDQ